MSQVIYTCTCVCHVVFILVPGALSMQEQLSTDTYLEGSIYGAAETHRQSQGQCYLKCGKPALSFFSNMTDAGNWCFSLWRRTVHRLGLRPQQPHILGFNQPVAQQRRHNAQIPVQTYDSLHLKQAEGLLDGEQMQIPQAREWIISLILTSWCVLEFFPHSKTHQEVRIKDLIRSRACGICICSPSIWKTVPPPVCYLLS
jgi:hypothetical protein